MPGDGWPPRRLSLLLQACGLGTGWRTFIFKATRGLGQKTGASIRRSGNPGGGPAGRPGADPTLFNCHFETDSLLNSIFVAIHASRRPGGLAGWPLGTLFPPPRESSTLEGSPSGQKWKCHNKRQLYWGTKLFWLHSKLIWSHVCAYIRT